MMLEKKLKEFNPKFDWYLGKPSVAEPIFVHNSYEKVFFAILNLIYLSAKLLAPQLTFFVAICDFY